MGNLPTCQAVLPDFVLRQRLEAVRARLLELERCYPSELGLDTALDIIEDTLTGLGWQRPPLSAHDLAVLAALGCPPA